MALAPTTHTALREAITDAIRVVPPTDTYEQNQGWEPQEDPDQVAGPTIRHFCISDMGSSSDVTDGVIANGAIETSTNIVVLTSYGAVPQLQVMDVADADRADLLAMLRLAAATESIVGLKGIGDSDTALTDSEADGNALVEHTIELRYMKATRR